jgi:hypothetical protein
MEVTNLVGISADVEDSIVLEIVSKTVCEIVDSAGIVRGLLVNVDVLCSVVGISVIIEVFISLPSVEDNMSLTTSEVLVMILLALVELDIVV